jgi:hypothetical protein
VRLRIACLFHTRLPLNERLLCFVYMCVYVCVHACMYVMYACVCMYTSNSGVPTIYIGRESPNFSTRGPLTTSLHRSRAKNSMLE